MAMLFPGMDPYIEMTEWPDFHLGMMSELKRLIVPQVIPKYIVQVERHIYLEHFEEDEDVQYRPDLTLLSTESQADLTPAGVATLTQPRIYTVPLPHEERHTSLVIRRNDEARKIVTAIEVLSPANKRIKSDGYRRYSKKREELLSARQSHLIEIDLLRHGRRPLTRPAIQSATDYCALVHRLSIRPRVEVFEWTLRDSMPKIPLPLLEPDDDRQIDLQAAFTALWGYSAYEVYLPYSKNLNPPPRSEDMDWLEAVLASRQPA